MPHIAILGDVTIEISEAKKTAVWEHMLSLPKSIWPRGMAEITFERLKPVVWDNTDFWQLVLVNGADLISLDELKKRNQSLYEDFIGNYFQVLYQLAV